MPNLQDAINAATFNDPVKAIEAFNRGAELARAQGYDDVPLDIPHDAVFEVDIEGMGPVRVYFAESVSDDG